MHPAELCDMACSHFNIYKVLLSCYIYCIMHPRCPEIEPEGGHGPTWTVELVGGEKYTQEIMQN
jgi:hypothetical protein